VNNADKIRLHGKERYVLPARKRGDKRFSIQVGDVVRTLRLIQRVPAVCSALKTGKFLGDNNLRLVQTTAPKSGQSTTVVYTYEFVDRENPPTEADPFELLWGSMKDVFAEYGGGEAYLRAERDKFYSDGADK
jgi:hypothetical protein